MCFVWLIQKLARNLLCQTKKHTIMNYDEISNNEFGMDYEQLGTNEQEWVRDEYDILTNY